MDSNDVQKQTVANLLSEMTGISSDILLGGIEKFGYTEIINTPLLLDITTEEAKELTNVGLLVQAEESGV